jgi:hypothetical protein
MKAIGDNSTLKGKVDGMVFRVHSVGNWCGCQIE